MEKVLRLIFWPFIPLYEVLTFNTYPGPVIIAVVVAAIVTFITLIVGAGANVAFIIPMVVAYIVGTINFYAATFRRGDTGLNELTSMIAAYILLFGALIILL